MARCFANTAGGPGPALNAATPVAVTRPLRPYPGLRPFEQEEWSIFFGREKMIDEVIDRLAQSRLVLIHGVSGSGKSSLVRAGVLPKLALQYQRHDAPWLTCAMRPSGGPLWNLAAEFARLEGRAGEAERIGEIAGRFDARSATLASVAASLDEGVRGKSVCVLVDQFEELFRFEKEIGRDEAELFVNLMTRAETSGQGADTPGVDLHVIVTMRSEFLGECARFAGFAETINRTQYLVPRMDDAGLMRAVVGPAETYGAVFDPALAERLIASVRGREDELPLLQHGLALMWDDALRQAGANGTMRMEGTIVDKAGGLAKLLSQHADQVMASAAPDERGKRIVEAVFRALTEVNAEGAAIRRPCGFDNLCAVAGGSPDEVRPIVDAFRAPGVSFLTPYAPEPIDAKTPIDVSHEALIRCWREIGPGANGWLLKEFRDGVAWRTLLLQAENFAEDNTFLLSEAASETRASWLAERNEAWSQRYGGGWPKVVALIEASREHWRRRREASIALAVKQRSRRNRWIVAIPLAAGLVGAGIYMERQREARQADVDKSAVRTAKTLLEDVLHAYNARSLDLAGAEGLAAISGQFLDSVRGSTRTSAADLLWAQALIVDADLQATLNKDAEALALARQAKQAATVLTQSDPNALEPLQTLYDAQIRIGNALSAMGRSHYPEAHQAYSDAIAVAMKIASLGGSDLETIDAHMKIGDLNKDLNQLPQALAEYQSGLATIEAALAKQPNSFDLLRSKGRPFYRIAELMRAQGSVDEARAYYQKAFEVQSALVARNAQEALAGQKAPDLTLKSNLAATYSRWGLLERQAGNLDLAVEKFGKGIALNEELAKAEPNNPQWLDYVAPNYLFIAEILEQSGRSEDAQHYYQRLFDARRTLAARRPDLARLQAEFADAAKLLGDRLTGLSRIDAYRSAVRTWGRLIDDPNSSDLAAGQYDAVLGIARALDAVKDWPDAESAYRVAEKIAVLNYVKDPSDTAWRDKAEAAERASPVAGPAAETPPADAPRP
jgi:tetratricopeptide (TPR) repeat protein